MAIVDISHHQAPSKINYGTFCNQLELAIIRVQYGSRLIDRHYKTHIFEIKSRGIPYGVYAWVRGNSEADMRTEAKNFYERAKDFNPSFYVLDIEEKSMSDMRGGINAYVDELSKLTDKKIGGYIAHHYYKPFNIDTGKLDFVWIPRYGLFKPSFPCDLWQYTSSGKLNGYSGKLDLNKLMNGRAIDFFLGNNTVTTDDSIVKNDKTIVALQTVIGVKADGIPGPITLSKCPTLRRGNRTDVVAWVQAKLGIKEDGIFGYNTEQAIKTWQKENGLVSDGIFGQKSWKKMLGL